MNKKTKNRILLYLVFLSFAFFIGNASADYAATPRYSCPSGGSLSGSACVTTSVYAASLTGGIYFSIPIRKDSNGVYYPNSATAFPVAGYLASSLFDYAKLIRTVNTGYLSPVQSCPVGYPCTNIGYSSDYPYTGLISAPGWVGIANTGLGFIAPSAGTYGATYSCPSGGNLSGTSCYNTSSYAATVTYTCPNGGILSGTICKTPVNGVCGTSNGQIFTIAPTLNLCASGIKSIVSSTSTGWIWTCAGSNGGSTVGCSAKKPINGTCGSVSGTSSLTKPTLNLCATGTQTIVSGTGPWTWSCLGINGGTAMTTCRTNLQAGTCGLDNGANLTTTPTRLCATGVNSAISGTGPWTWTCNGTACKANKQISCSACSTAYSYTLTNFKGSNVCTSPIANTTTYSLSCACGKKTSDPFGYTATCGPVNGICGTANGQIFATVPTLNLCSAGTNTAVTSNTTGWAWTCVGKNGGTTANCAAKKPINGVCATPPNGTTMLTKPTGTICTAGTATAILGNGPWTWTCLGINNGSTASCKANMQAGNCGLDNGANLTSTPTRLCSTGTASVITGTGPWAWTCNGTTCSASKQVDCERCSDVDSFSFVQYKGSNDCANVIDSTVVRSMKCDCGLKVSDPFAYTSLCMPPSSVDALCASSGISETAPTNYCSKGDFDSDSFNETSTGWTWRCLGQNGGINDNCLVQKPEGSLGICGTSDGKAFDKKPESNLCNSGTPSAVDGIGPWSWTCVGSDSTANCNASLMNPGDWTEEAP